MRPFYFLIMLTATILLAPPASALAGPNRLAPASEWAVARIGGACSLSRAFGTERNRAYIQFLQLEREQDLELRLMGKPLKVGDRWSTTLTVGEGNESLQIKPSLRSIGNGKIPVLMMGNRPLAEYLGLEAGEASVAERLDAVGTLSLFAEGGFHIVFETGPLTQPLAELAQCTDDLYRSWGIDLSDLDQIVSEPTPLTSPATWLNTGDYPVDMLNKRLESRLHFVIIVDPDGSVGSCHVQSITTDVRFGEVACEKISKRATFEPARNAAGEAVRSIYRNRVEFRMMR